MVFTDTEIHKLFGHEAAEAEDPSRLRDYYFKSRVYERVIEELPLRILVGHKGTGKSALFSTAHSEEIDTGVPSILIRPDDFDVSQVPENQINLQIKAFKEKIIDLIYEKVTGSQVKSEESVTINQKLLSGVKLLDLIIDVVKPLLKNSADTKPLQAALHKAVVERASLNVYLDDLDRGWTGTIPDIQKMSALLNALRDLARIHPEMRFRLALRTDVYYLVRTSDESTDKIEGSVVWCSWSNHEILAMLVKRVCAYQGRAINEADLLNLKQDRLTTYLKDVMELTFQGNGHWHNAPIHRVLMSLIRKRPRDLVKLCTLAAQRAYASNSPRIMTQHWSESFQEYSDGRLTDTINEFKSELPEIKRLLLGMRVSKRELEASQNAESGFNPNQYSTDALVVKIKTIQNSGVFRFSNGKIASPHDLIHFMYKINFITARKVTPHGIVRVYFEERSYLGDKFSDFGNGWEVHPAYRWALQPLGIDTIFQNLELSFE